MQAQMFRVSRSANLHAGRRRCARSDRGWCPVVVSRRSARLLRRAARARSRGYPSGRSRRPPLKAANRAGRQEAHRAAGGRVQPEQLTFLPAAWPAGPGTTASWPAPDRPTDTGPARRSRTSSVRTRTAAPPPTPTSPTSDVMMIVLGPIRSSSRPPANAPAAATTLAATPKMMTCEALSPYTRDGQHRAEAEHRRQPVAVDGAGDQEPDRVAVGAEQGPHVCRSAPVRGEEADPARSGLGGTSGTASSTGIAHTANQTATTRASTR